MARRKKAADNGGDHKNGTGQMSLNLTFDTAKSHLDTIVNLEQQMADIRTDLANEYKAFESHGGDRKMLKWAKRLAKQDPAKSAAELRQFDQYRSWFVDPAIKSMMGSEAAEARE